MTTEEILIIAIEIAVKNGYNYSNISDEIVFYLDRNNRGLDGYFSLIFSHDFAKAFFGEDKKCYYCKGESKTWQKGTCPECFNNPNYKNLWQHHLKQMVLEEEPLKYLEKFL